MALIFDRAKQQGLTLPKRVDGAGNTWVFSKNLVEQDLDFFKTALRQLPVLSLEYNLICTQLAHDFIQGKAKPAICAQVEVALALAELLEILNRDYLDVPREIMRLQQEQKLFKEFLVQHGYQFPTPSLHVSLNPGWNIDRRTHNTTVELNWLRLMTIRIRRLLVVIAPMTAELSTYRRWVVQFDRFLNPFLLHLAWLFFTPRLLVNLTMMLKHVIPGHWMSDQEKALGWEARLLAEWKKRWFELGNDTLWLISGIINCFILTGALAPFAIYVSVALQGFDVMLACMRMIHESSRFNRLYKHYETLLKDDKLSYEQREEITTYLRHLQQKMSHEQQRLWLGIINTSVLLGAIILAIPLFGLNPLIPLIGAAIAVSMTIASYIITKRLENKNSSPEVTVLTRGSSALTQHSLFSSAKNKSPSSPKSEHIQMGDLLEAHHGLTSSISS
ncbi:hypothetical protein [Legionella yabuuchiae]|uniref:hypothetical protein n=1 Tax=Legionella yabuuchiae TaxID=376727 RepID=UPI001055F0C6|nr:hypothetical protein [Legionella yabuuchiae]